MAVNAETARRGCRDAEHTSDDTGDDLERVLLRKERRNARDRKRSQLKKDTMEAMRQQVAQLELEKRRLEVRFPGRMRLQSNAENVARGHLPPFPTTTTLQDHTQKQYLGVLQQIERLRHENRAMTLDLLARDLFRSAAQNLLDAMVNHGTVHEDAEAPCSLPVSPLRHEDAVAFAERMVTQIGSARVESDQMQRFTGARVFGWSDFRCRTGATVRFSIKKSFAHHSARFLANATWRLLRDTDSLRRVLPAGLEIELREVQRVNEDAVVIDRITRDHQFDDERLRALRTTYMLARARPSVCDDSTWVVGMKTIDMPAFKMGLAESEMWCDIFYWFHFEDGRGDERVTAVVFGGSLSYFSETLARSWLAELVFLAVRWESIVVATSLLPPSS